MVITIKYLPKGYTRFDVQIQDGDGEINLKFPPKSIVSMLNCSKNEQEVRLEFPVEDKDNSNQQICVDYEDNYLTVRELLAQKKSVKYVEAFISNKNGENILCAIAQWDGQNLIPMDSGDCNLDDPVIKYCIDGDILAYWFWCEED